MDFLTMMKTRKSCRAYRNEPVSRENLLKIVEAGRLTPSACNSQPWHFIVVDEPEAKANLCDALVMPDGRSGCPWREQVPAFLILCETEAHVVNIVKEVYGDNQHFAPGDIGAAAMNMCHQAMDLGLDSCILGLNDQSKMETHFGIPAGHAARLVISLGYAAENAPAPSKLRKPLEEICSFNHW